MHGAHRFSRTETPDAAASGPTRRAVLGGALLGAAGLAVGGGLLSRADAAGSQAAAAGTLRVPSDDVAHVRTWMAWPTKSSIWGRQLNGVQNDVALIAKSIARFEPVVMCAPDATSASDARARCGSSVTVISTIPVDDLWMRDTGPVFRTDGAGGRDTVGLGFNGWGNKQTHAKDALVASRIAAYDSLAFTRAGFTGEGGAIETDGDGTVMATESSLVNSNRNPGKTKAQVEAAVLAAYGASKMLWVPGIKGQDITDDHIDATSRFIAPGVVMVQVPPASRTDIWAQDARKQLQILSNATDAKGRRLQVIRIDGPDTVRSNSEDFVDSYVNFHVCNGGVVMAQFGDTAKDAAAKQVVAAAYPGRQVVQIDIDRIALGGGGVHCSTMQEPRA
ncbi:agmatine deiminase family protein [Yinghuangia seranimata]|uniref:agmatine deiminase family protein n=1 Tax=Yinghuangia seranimata TaxID=408067 RepID=UPI00248BBE94|nr:agmatine deiminase family protein [Yinghuangia seranimata]MDI2125629.1 agmatine deiminase family protein [Yinghuangia seranimata]